MSVIQVASSYVLFTVMRDWRLKGGQTHPLGVCCLPLVCGRRNRKRMETVFGTNSTFKTQGCSAYVAQGETL